MHDNEVDDESVCSNSSILAPLFAPASCLGRKFADWLLLNLIQSWRCPLPSFQNQKSGSRVPSLVPGKLDHW